MPEAHVHTQRLTSILVLDFCQQAQLLGGLSTKDAEILLLWNFDQLANIQRYLSIHGLELSFH